MKNLQLLIIPLLVFISCEETEETDVDLGDYHLFTASFEEGEFADDVTSFIFISDGDGNVLADSGFIGAASFELFADTSLSPPPDKIGVTTVTIVGNTYGIVTNLGIDKGSEWTWYNPYYEPESQGSSYYTFSNVSENNVSRVVLSSSGFSYRTTVDNTSSTYSLDHYHTTEDVSIMAYKEDGTAIYTILEDVEIDQTYNIDLSTFLPATYKIITNSTGEECDDITLYGYDADDSVIRYNRHRFTDRGYYEGQGWNENRDFFVNYPPEFSKFGTYITVGQYYVVGEKYWLQRRFGDIPESVEKINADISVIKSDPLDFEVSTNGVFDQWSVSFNDSISNGNWAFYVNPNISSGSIPIIPSSVYAEYPELSGASFKMRSVGAIDYLCVDSYQEWLELYFSTDGYYGDFCPEYRSVGYRVY
jgi:hypothetical protein